MIERQRLLLHPRYLHPDPERDDKALPTDGPFGTTNKRLCTAKHAR
jgi:hypothetical protein